jgi:tetratricopeptide (TPR) repeat protein
MSFTAGRAAPYRVMVSSTRRDLSAHRDVVLRALPSYDMLPVAMEYDAALAADDLISASLKKVEQSDAYIGIVGYRDYGQIPDCPRRNPKKLALTELEFRRAVELKKPICMFLMSANHLVPASQTPAGRGDKTKLTAFRKLAMSNRISAEFDSVEDLRAKVQLSLKDLQEVLSAEMPVAPKEHLAEGPKRAPEFYAVTDYIPGHAFVGRTKDLPLLDDWAKADEPVLLFEAIGGTGKSMLTWHWVRTSAPKIGNWAGRFWYSFYERGADMDDFCAHALAYTSGRAVKEFLGRKTAQLTPELIDALHRDAWLFVLDGLERVLVAYNRLDAAQAADEDVERDPEQAGRHPRACIRPADEELLRLLTGARPSKILVTSRLMPRVMLNRSGQPLPGVRHVSLRGLDPADAERMMRAAGVRGDSGRMQQYIEKHFSGHPLVVGAVAGLVIRYRPAPGNFDKWVEDPQGGAEVDLAAMDLVQKRNHILKAAFDHLTQEERALMVRLGMISDAVDLETIEALNPSGPEVLDDLEQRGLLNWDRLSNKYDLHPVIRNYATYYLPMAERQQVGRKVVDYFNSRSDPPHEKARTLADLRNGLQVARSLLQIGNLERAYQVITGDLRSSLWYNLERYNDFLELLRPYFPNGWTGRAQGLESALDLSVLSSDASVALAMLGRRTDVLGVQQSTIADLVGLKKISGLCVTLGNHGLTLRDLGRIEASERVLQFLEKAAAFSGEDDRILAMQRRFEYFLEMGRITEAEAELRRFRRPQSRARYLPGPWEAYRVRLRVYQNRLDDETIQVAMTTAEEDNNRVLVRHLLGLEGFWLLRKGRFAEAEAAYEQAIAMARESGVPRAEHEAERGIAKANQGKIGDARETAERLELLEHPPSVSLAELYLALGDRAKALEHVKGGYRWAWAEGSPYVRWWYLQRCRAVLEALGEPEPQLPAFDPSQAMPLPFEAELRAFLEELKAEKAQEETDE